MEIRETETFIAMEVAEAFIEANETEDRDRDHIIEAALLVGQHLADCDIPGHWASFDAATFFPKLQGTNQHELVGLSIQVMALFQWLGLRDAIDIDRAAMISAQIRDHAPPNPILADFHACYQSHVAALR